MRVPDSTVIGIEDVARAAYVSLGGDLREVEAPRLLEPLPATAWDFALRCAYTYDERGPEFGREVIARFPDKAYLRFAMEAIEREPLVWIEKSGQILISWLVAVWALHDVLSKRGRAGAWFCLDRTLASKHLEQRVLRLYEAIPAGYAKPAARMLAGNFLVYHDGIDNLPTSGITAMAQETSVSDEAAKRSRSWTWTWAHVDEAAFTRRSEELFGTLQNRCGKIIAPSTPNGPATYHHRIGYGKSLASADTYKLVEPAIEERPMRGIKGWRRHGFYCLDIGYEADPEKDPALPAGARWWNHPSTVAARAKTDIWAREMERNAAVQTGLAVYTDTDRLVLRPQMYYPHLPLIRGHDYSFAMNVMLASQVRKGEDGRWRLHTLREVWTENADILKHKAHCVKELAEAYGARPGRGDTDYGDYSANTRTSTGVLIDQMRPEFGLITVPTGPGGVLLRTTLVQYVVSEGLWEIDPEHCPMLVQAIKTGYVRDKDGTPGTDHPWADFADAAGYKITNIFELHPLAGGGSVAVVKPEWTQRLERDEAQLRAERRAKAMLGERGYIAPVRHQAATR